MAKVVVRGAEALKRKLEELQVVTGGRALGNAMLGGALVVQTEAKRLAPFLTGNLRRSIHSELVSATTHRAEVSVGTDVVYARAQELGYPQGNLPAHPYLRPAADKTKPQVARAVGMALKAQIDAVARAG